MRKRTTGIVQGSQRSKVCPLHQPTFILTRSTKYCHNPLPPPPHLTISHLPPAGIHRAGGQSRDVCKHLPFYSKIQMYFFCLFSSHPIPFILFHSLSFSGPCLLHSSFYFMWLERVGMGVMGIVGKKELSRPKIIM